mmetsp:Transcript_38470/g.71424  ORF Transcript_38470/g.71424 Transcript_38470/m.71424 type:complete len:259 (-) Transcript_38470:383-1159(-)
MISLLDSTTSLMTFCNLSSKSPLYLVPAKRPAKSRDMMRLPFRNFGRSRPPSEILCASPSAIAVFPTPGSPMRTGLFFLRRAKTCMVRSISGPRPTIGSSFPSAAILVKSREYCSSVAVLPPDWPPRPAAVEVASFCPSSSPWIALSISSRTCFGLTSILFKISTACPFSSLMSASRMWEVSIAFELSFLASSRHASRTCLASGEKGTSAVWRPAPLPMKPTTTLRMSSSLTPSFISTLAATPVLCATTPRSIISSPT